MELLLTIFVGAIACGMVYYAGYHRGVNDTENDEQKLATIKALAERKVDRVMEIQAIRDNPKAQEYIAVKCGAVPFPEPDKPVSYTVETKPMTPEEIARYGGQRREIKPVSDYMAEPNGTTDHEDDAPGGYYHVVNGKMTYATDKNSIKPPGEVVETCKTSKK